MDKQTLNVSKYNNVYVVGDLHGEFSKLEDKLEDVDFDPEKDLLVSVGDLVDRGGDSLRCLRLLDEDWFTCVKGNHEQMMMDSILGINEDMVSCWVHNGGMWYFQLTFDERMEVKDYCHILANYSPYELLLEYKGKRILVTHGDYPLDFYSENLGVDSQEIIWNRGRIEKHQKGITQQIKDVDLAIFGHTPLRKPTRSGNCIWIDTGACFGKELTLLNLDDLLKEEL